MTNKLKTILILLLTLVIHSTVIANDTTKVTTKNDPYEFEIYGFIRNDFTYDSRKTLASVGELFNFIPMDENINLLGEDLNAVPSTRLLAVVSRIGFNFNSPSFNGVRFNAKIETDFAGASTSYFLFRIRQAFVGIRWQQHQIIAGQTWHPMSGDLLPSIVSLNTGAPFNAFSRTPLIRYNAFIGPVTLSAAAIYQMQYTSPGPNGSSTQYQVFGGLPELYLGITYANNGLKIGFGGEFISLRPRTTETIEYEPEPQYCPSPLEKRIKKITDIKTETIKVNEIVNSFATQLFAQYSNKNFTIAAKSIYGQNTGHLLMMSGYGYYGTKEDGYSRYYSPLTQSSTWLTLAYHTSRPSHNIRATVLGGYMKNFGANHNLDGVYVRGYNNIDQMFRIAPSIQYTFKGLIVGIEYEYTGVLYGKPQANFSVAEPHLIDNHRTYVMLVYNFSHKFFK